MVRACSKVGKKRTNRTSIEVKKDTKKDFERVRADLSGRMGKVFTQDATLKYLIRMYWGE